MVARVLNQNSHCQVARAALFLLDLSSIGSIDPASHCQPDLILHNSIQPFVFLHNSS